MISTATLCDGEDDGRTMIKVEVLVVKVGAVVLVGVIDAVLVSVVVGTTRKR